ncbi:MAG TPA: hypothetical protein DDW53_03465 [Lachnoclostridium sp.]|nr:hypothetical protein [Lachnoclostridium sp.]
MFFLFFCYNVSYQKSLFKSLIKGSIFSAVHTIIGFVFYSGNVIAYQKSVLRLLIKGSISTAVHPIMKTCFHNVLYDKNRNIRGFAEERSLVL